MLLKNVSLQWAKLTRNNLDMGFDQKSPQYSVVVITKDKSQADEWKAEGLNVKPFEDDNGVAYKLNIKKKIYDEKTPGPMVVNGKLETVDGDLIGNNTLAHVQIKQKPYTFNGRSGHSVQLVGIQVIKLVEFTKGEKLAFEEINTDTANIEGVSLNNVSHTSSEDII